VGQILAQLFTDMGGDSSEAQNIVARRAATLAVWCEATEAAMAKGETLDVATFTTATNALRRLLADLGLERRARDVTPVLATYIEGRGSTPLPGNAGPRRDGGGTTS